MEASNNLAIPAFTAAAYSFLSILLTLFVFKETLPPERRGQGSRVTGPWVVLRMIRRPQLKLLLPLMFAQQFIFFGFESLLGLFTLSRLGLLGEGNAIVFLIVGVLLVTVQVRFIGPWTRRFGEHRLVFGALALIALGLIILAATPQQPQPFYVRQVVVNQLAQESDSSTEAIIGRINVPLPDEANRGVGGVLWALIAIVPLSIGAGLIRPSLNSLMTRQVSEQDYGSVLGSSAALVSAANASAPIIGGLLFQHYGATLPFMLGGVLMAILALLSYVVVQPAPVAVAE